MREIKFRAWDNINGLMMYGDATAAHDVGFWDGIECSTVEMVNSQLSKEFIWMQYTGLKDTNGVEIYEGDIVKFSVGKAVYTVEWHAGKSSFWLVCYAMGDRMESQQYSQIGLQAHLEIIGNIYESKYLLDK